MGWCWLALQLLQCYSSKTVYPKIKIKLYIYIYINIEVFFILKRLTF